MSLLTSYRPNFCCECGGKIVRLRWRTWHSRRFCTPCGSLYRKQRFVYPALILIAVTVLGVSLGRSMRPKPPPLIVQRVTPTGTTATNSPPQSTVVEEQVYICGAQTKKGTPCSRRVHGPVRCWQHRGMKAMLPDDKLIVKE